MATPTQQLAKIRNQGNLRAKKHYDANKTAINKKRREAYALKHGLVVAQPVAEPVAEPVVEDYEYDDDANDYAMDEPAVEQIVPPAAKKLTKAQEKKQKREVAAAKAKATREAKEAARETFTLEAVVAKVKGLGISRKATEQKYLDDIKRIMTSTKCKDFLQCLKNPKKFIADILKSTQKNGKKGYTANTHKSTFQFILKFIDDFKLAVDKAPYKEQFKLFQIQSATQNETKRQTGIVPTFKEYLEKSKAKFGEDSKEYLLGRLYEEMPVRDDFGLHILKREDATKKLNYLLMGRKNMEIVINHHKTDGGYGAIRHVLSKPLATMITEYLKNKKIKEDELDARTRKAGRAVKKHSELVFGAGSLSPFLTKTNKALGYTHGSNLFRHMAVTQLTADTPPEKKLALAAAMAHSPMVQMNYMRKNNIV